MKKRKIIIFSEYYIPKLGGVERYTDKLSDELKNDFDITIVTTMYGDCKEYEKNKSIKIIRLPIYNLFKNRYAFIKKNKEYRRLFSIIEKDKYDFCLCQTRFFPLSIIGVKYAKKNNIPTIVIEHGSSHFTVNNKVLDYFGEKYEHFVTSIVKRNCSNFYGVSERCVQWLKHFKISADGVLYNSIDDKDYNIYKNQFFFKKNNSDINICYAGRLIKEKGIYELCDAFQLLLKDYDNICLYVAGDGPELEELKKNYSSEKIVFLGKLKFDDMMKLYNSIDIFVYPSMYAEGLPTSILEAGVMKCAVVATDRGGTVEVIDHGKNGLICEENTDSIYGNIKYLLENPAKIKLFSDNIHKKIMSDFTWKSTANKLKKIIEKEAD